MEKEWFLSHGVCGANSQVKRHRLLAGFSVLLLAAMFTVAGCGDNGDPSSPPSGPQTVTYSGTANGTTYTLVITENTSRYAAQPGDSYELTVGSKTSSGTVTGAGATLTLTPTGKTATFTVTVSGNNITTMGGTITFTDNTTAPAPAALTPGGGGGETDNSAQLNGTWVKGSNYAVEFTVPAKTYRMGAWSGGNFNGQPTTGTFTYLGTTLTFIVGQQNMPGTAIISGTTLTLSGFGGQSDGAYTKQGGGSTGSFVGTWIGGQANTGRFEIKDDDTWSIGTQAPYVGFVAQYTGTYTVSGGTATFTGTSAVGGAPIIGTNTATVNGNTLTLNAGGSLMTSFGQTWTRSD